MQISRETPPQSNIAPPAGATPEAPLIWSPGDDPHEWLEHCETPRVAAWVAEQNAGTLHAYAHGAPFDTLLQRFVDEALSPDQLIVPTRHGDWAHDFRQDEAHPIGIWRRSRWADWLAGRPQWQTLVDLDALSETEDVDWSWQSASVRYPDRERALLFLSPGGGDATVVREFDLVTLTFVEDGFNVETIGKHGANWIDRDTVYFEWDPSEGDTAHPAVTRSGYPREVRRWSRGTRLEDAPVVFRCEADDISASVLFDVKSRRHFAFRSITFDEGTTHWLDGEQWQPYDVPLDADVYTWKGWLVIAPSRDWTVGGATHRGGCLIAIREAAFLEGERTFLPLFTPGPKTALAGFETGKTWAAISYADDLLTRTRFWQPPAIDEEIAALDGLGIDPVAHTFRELPIDAGSETSAWFIDDMIDDTLFLTTHHYLEPPTLWLSDARAADLGERRRIQQLPASFDAADMTVIRASATAPDGTEIPYWVVGKRALIENGVDGAGRTNGADEAGNPNETGGMGDTGEAASQRHSGRRPAPCLLYGYGGFEVALEPSYASSAGMGWLEQGGIYVVANIRGGGEYGPEWHRAAIREKRPVAFDDFVAVARALVDEGFTTERQLAIQGGSNGGLLVAACMIRHPELFGAVVCEVPVLDMQRFHTLLAGASWMEEYGDPDKPEDARFLAAYSPYHRVSADVTYPPILLTAAAGDDRVHPAHARKMAAKMQAMGHPEVWYYEETQGGHDATPDPRDAARSEALVYRFLWETVGR